MKTSSKAKIAAVMLPFALFIAACGSDSEPSSSSNKSDTTAAPADDSADTTAADDMGDDASQAAAPEGPGCAAVPEDGDGSFEGMAQDPVATAASNNPALSTLVTAVKAAGLVDTLNTAKDITVFAPANSAFEAMDQATLKKALGEPKGLLTDVLTAHVVAGRLSPDQLAGEHQSLNKSQPVTVTGSGESFTVNGEAMVVCGNVQTANATVYIIDKVLLPKS
jgi:uncharacterized surface protein with fasciclin (FAS1) repeats